LKNSAILLVQCPDRRGLDAALADFIYQHNGNILHFEEHQVGEKGFYLARVEWDLTGFQLDVKEFPQKFAPIAEKFAMTWRLALGSYQPRVAIFVSKYDHCLVDLLYRQRNGELLVKSRSSSATIRMPSATPIFTAFRCVPGRGGAGAGSGRLEAGGAGLGDGRGRDRHCLRGDSADAAGRCGAAISGDDGGGAIAGGGTGRQPAETRRECAIATASLC